MQEWVDRRETSKIVVERVIILLRYMFSIGMEGPKCAEVPSVDVQVKQKVVGAFLRSTLPDALFTAAADRMDKGFAVHILAIFSLMLRSFVSSPS